MPAIIEHDIAHCFFSAQVVPVSFGPVAQAMAKYRPSEEEGKMWINVNRLLRRNQL